MRVSRLDNKMMLEMKGRMEGEEEEGPGGNIGHTDAP